jgi:hypothetical protein
LYVQIIVKKNVYFCPAGCFPASRLCRLESMGSHQQSSTSALPVCC